VEIIFNQNTGHLAMFQSSILLFKSVEHPLSNSLWHST